MTKFKLLFILLSVGSLVPLSSCNKDCAEDKDVISKKGLALSGLQEVPPVMTPAMGKMDVSYDKKTRLLKYDISWSELTGNPVGSHIHGTARRGVNAPVKHDFTSAIPKVPTGIYSGSALVDGVAIKEDSLLAGFYYLNIHTAKYPGGEIRGQIEFK